MDFPHWLAARIDCQQPTPELLAMLHAEWEAQQPVPPAPTLVVPVECQWPARGYWIPTGQ